MSAKPPGKCARCGAPIIEQADRMYMRDGEKYFHLNCFPAYLRSKNRRLHRGLPERLYWNPSEAK